MIGEALGLIRNGFRWPRGLYQDSRMTVIRGSRNSGRLGPDPGPKTLDANVVMSPIQWVQRTITQSEVVVQRLQNGKWMTRASALDRVLANPTPYYGLDPLIKAATFSYLFDGNSYLWLRRIDGQLRQIWWLPHWCVDPVTTEADRLITAYRYSPPHGRTKTLGLQEVAHIRFGIDPWRTEYGLSPIRAILQEAGVDMEAARFTSAIMENLGVPGLMVSPKEGRWTPERVTQLRDFLREEYTGDRRGKNFVLSEASNVDTLAVDMNAMNITGVRDVSEERICAAIGLPAAVVGFGSGLQSTKVGATMRQLVALARVACVEPTQTTISRAISAVLFPNRDQRIRFDTSGYGLFAEDLLESARRATMLYRGGVVALDIAQDIAGVERHEVPELPSAGSGSGGSPALPGGSP